MRRRARTALGIAFAIGGAVLLAWYVRRIGPDKIADGFRQLGFGVILIALMSVVRFMSRTEAWRILLANPLPFSRAFPAVLAGDALGNVTPVAFVASEPTKALFVSDLMPASRALAALVAENFFYSISITAYILLGAAAMLYAFDLPPLLHTAGLWSVISMTAMLVGCAWLAWQKPTYVSALTARLPGSRFAAAAGRIRDFELEMYGATGHEGFRLGKLALVETSFHAVSFLEAWYTLYLLTGASQPLAAFILDAFSRVSNIIFRLIPLRLGVDQAGSGLVAKAIGLDPAIGATLSLVRTARVLLFAVIGLAILAKRTGTARSLD